MTNKEIGTAIRGLEKKLEVVHAAIKNLERRILTMGQASPEAPVQTRDDAPSKG